MRPDAILALGLGLTTVVGLAWLLGGLARRLGQPQVVGETLGGVLLGPTLFDGAITRALFPAEVRPPLALLADVGVVLFMFLVGLELDRSLLRGAGRVAASVSVSAIALPFTLGGLLGLYLLRQHPTEHRWAFVLFVGTAMSVTAFPVLARILTDRGLLNTPIGGLALVCASVDDVLAWSLLAVVVALAKAVAVPWQLLLVLPDVGFLLLVVRPLLARLAVHVHRATRGRRSPVHRIAMPGVAAIGVWLSAAATDGIGLHLMFGAFLFGVAMPREPMSLFDDRVLAGVRRVCSVVLLPVFFTIAGIRVDLSSVSGTAFRELALILLVAIGGKCVGAFVPARLHGVTVRHSAVLAILVNTRGLTELIVLTVGLQLGVLDSELYSLLVVMAVVTTAMAGVLLGFVYPPHRVAEDRTSVMTTARAAE